MNDLRKRFFEIRREVVADTGVSSVSDISEFSDDEVIRHAAELEVELERWLAAYPGVLQNRNYAVAMIYAASFGSLGAEITLLAAKVTALVFTLDDIVDSVLAPLTDRQADAYLSMCREFAQTSAIDIEAFTESLDLDPSPELRAAWFDTARGFRDFCADFRRAYGAEETFPVFDRAYAAVMDGMRYEMRTRRERLEAGALPSFDEYLDWARGTIATPMIAAVVLAAWAQRGEIDGVSEHRAAIEAFTFAGGAGVRLANDVRSYAREVEIDGTANALSILMREDGVGMREAEAEVVRRCDESLATSTDFADQLPERFRAWSGTIYRYTRILRDWYMVREFH